MPRGGARQGTPGRGYSNRTDLAVKPDMSKGTQASGGMEAPPDGPAPRTPDHSPMLSDPTARPDEPLTHGLPSGPGGGPEALNQFDTRNQETENLRKWLPLLKPVAEDPEAPESVKILYRYIRGSG